MTVLSNSFGKNLFDAYVFSAHFDLDTCSNCELREVCRIKFQKKSCVVRFEEKTLIADQTRASIKIELQENTSQRAAIEGTNSALKRGHGADNIKVRGLYKSKVIMGLKFTALNFKKFARCITSQVEKIPSHPDYGIVIP